MSTLYTDPPQSRNEAIIKSTIDGTQYTDPPQSRMEDLLLELKEAIEQGGGGTTVVANPEGEATDDLEKLQVGNDIYEIPQDYEDLDNKPQINGETLDGNKTASDLGLQTELDGAQTVEGNPITVTDAEAMNAESVEVELEPKQDLHGYDAPWVGGSGKNLLPMTVDGIKALNTSGTWSGNTYSINNTTVEILTDETNVNVNGFKVNTGSGGASAEVDFMLTNAINIQGSFVVNGCPENGSVSTYYIAVETQNFSWNYRDVGNGVEINNDTIKQVALVVTGIANNLTFYPMIRLATETDPTFAPYSNICPISGYSEVNVERVGKNLLNINASGIVQNAMFDIQTLETVGSENYDISDYIEVKEGVTYKYSRVADVLSVPSGVFYDKDKNPISLVTNIFTMTIPSGIKYVRLELLKVATNQQLEFGSSKTTYEPYQGDTYTISLGGTKYGGTLDVTEGGYSDSVYSIDVGNTIYAINSQTSDTVTAFVSFSINNLPNGLNGEVYSNIFSKLIPSGNVGRMVLTNNNLYLMLPKEELATIDDSGVKAWMISNGAQLLYKLATPLTIQLTPTQIQMLENTNNISTDGTNITLKYQPNNVIGECKVYTDEQCAKVLPPLPTTDGTYHLSCEVTSGVGVLSWVSDS